MEARRAFRTSSRPAAGMPRFQERSGMIRASSWQVVTSEAVPPMDEDLAGDDASDASDDPSNELLTDPTEFLDDLTDTETSEPGLLEAFDAPLLSAKGLDGLVE